MALNMEVDLDPERIIAEASRATGLSDFGDHTLPARLAAMAAALDADTGLSGLGRHIVRDRMVGLVRARLRFEDFVRRHPEALDVALEPPVIVVGLPRSGTTHLVNLLAADSRFRSMPWWEVIEPTPVAGDGPGRDGVDPRYLRCLRVHETTQRVAPLAALMHDRPPWSIEEDCELVDLDFCSYVTEWHARVPGWRDALPRPGPAPALRVPPPGAAGPQLPARAESLGAQVPAAPGTARAPHGHVPGRDDRLHAPGSGGRAAVGHDHAGLRGPAATGARRGRRARRLLGRPDRAAPRSPRSATPISSPGTSGSTSNSTNSWPTISPWPSGSSGSPGSRSPTGPVPSSPPIWPAIRGARTDGSSTTCGATSDSIPRPYGSGSPSTIEAFPQIRTEVR